MADKAEPALLAVALAEQSGIVVSGRAVGLVGALLATEVPFAVAPWSWRLARAVLRPKALQTRPRLDQRAENRNGFAVDVELTRALGTAERLAALAMADAPAGRPEDDRRRQGYDARDFVIAARARDHPEAGSPRIVSILRDVRSAIDGKR